MKRFNRTAYIDTLRPLILEAMRATRNQGCNIGNHNRDGDATALNDAVDAAQQALLDALYSLPRELDGAPIKRSAA